MIGYFGILATAHNWLIPDDVYLESGGDHWQALLGIPFIHNPLYKYPLYPLYWSWVTSLTSSSGNPWSGSIFLLPNLLPFGSCANTISYAIWFLSHYYPVPDISGWKVEKLRIEVKRKTVLSDLLENFTFHNFYLEAEQNGTGCVVAPQQELVRTEIQMDEEVFPRWRGRESSFALCCSMRWVESFH